MQMADNFVESIDISLYQNALQIIRNQLNKDKIKLWEAPYTSPTRESHDIPEDLVQAYSEKFGFDKHLIKTVLEELRSHAVEKLAARKKFAENGIATLKIKLGRFASKDGKKELKIETILDVTVNDLKEIIKTNLEKDLVQDIQLISCGQILDNERTLTSYNVKNNAVIMAICKTNVEVEERKGSAEGSSMSKKIAKTRKVAEALAKRKGASKGKHERFYLEIRDQTGKEIQLPDEERQSLSLAMTFHDLGRDLLKEEQYDEAILLLLESDSEFRKCRSEVLRVVDNYALLCLDVVWCYFKIGNLENLPDAEQRLRSCRDSLERSYGPNLERACQTEGRSGSEIKSYVRLHLLEGICAYCKGQYSASSMYLAKAEQEARCFAVDDNKLSQVISMGFTAAEAKRALIACKGDVTEAVDFITKRKERQRELRENEKTERERWKLSRKLGKTVDGSWVNAESYATLRRLGFSKKMAQDSLKHSNNNIDQALELLQTNPQLLDVPEKRRRRRKHKNISIPDGSIQQVVSMGFDPEIARKALIRHGGNVQSCVEELLLYSGSFSEEFENPHQDYYDDPNMEDDDHDDGDHVGDDDYDDDSSTDEEEIAVDQEVATMMGGLGKSADGQNNDEIQIDDELKLIEEYTALLTAANHL